MIRVAACQCRPLTGDIPANLNRLAATAVAVAGLGADVLVLPELYLTGYALGDRLETLALPPDSPVLATVADIARTSGVAIVLGYPERRRDGLYNMAALWDRDGRLVSRYAKVQLYGAEEQRRFRPGGDLTAFAWRQRRAGLLICYDVEFPEPARHLAEQAADIIFAPTANMQPFDAAATTLVPARALENGVAMVYANYVGAEGGLIYTGLSTIVGPDGQDCARAGRVQEAVLIADVGFDVPVKSTQLADRRRPAGG